MTSACDITWASQVVPVSDVLKRKWERGIYMGADSTNPEAVKRHRPANA